MTKTKHLTKILQQPRTQVYKSNPKGFNIKTILKKTYRSDIHLSMIVLHILDIRQTIVIMKLNHLKITSWC